MIDIISIENMLQIMEIILKDLLMLQKSMDNKLSLIVNIIILSLLNLLMDSFKFVNLDVLIVNVLVVLKDMFMIQIQLHAEFVDLVV